MIKEEEKICTSKLNLYYLGHFITFFWKGTLALIPPTNIFGGWLTFICSLAVIALLTALMGDLATLFGCVLHWDMHSTSITVVAVGTSLPDLFASRVAAQRDNCADNAIGNINGSNAFNVFLGLGKHLIIISYSINHYLLNIFT